MSNIHSPKYEKYYDQIKKGYSEGKTAREIIDLINSPEITNPKQVYKIAQTIGIRKREDRRETWKKFAKVDKQALALIKSGISCTKTAEMLGIDQQSMNKRLKEHYGLTVLPDGKKTVNGHFFDIIDTEEKAYWLGFMYADGYVGKKNAIELCLQERDKAHLLNFCKSIKANQKIGIKKIALNGKIFRAYRISIKDTNLAMGLKKNGCVNSKSLSIQMPDLQSKELYRHFIRGFFDGDGCISRSGGTYLAVEFTCASIDFCKSIVAYAKDLLKIRMIIKDTKNEQAYSVSTTSRMEAFRFLQHMYSNCNFYLDRKYKQYCNICRLESILPETPDDEDGIKRGWRNVD